LTEDGVPLSSETISCDGIAVGNIVEFASSVLLLDGIIVGLSEMVRADESVGNEVGVPVELESIVALLDGIIVG